MLFHRINIEILMEEENVKSNMDLQTAENTEYHGNEDRNKERRTDLLMSNIDYDVLKEELLNHVADSKAIFKSQQKSDPELMFEEKRVIAGKLLEKSHCLFLSKFGHHLKKEHLEYFGKTEDYETAYHINRLRRYLNNSTRHIDVRNRRYQALKKLIETGEYFSECEMMKRNPLLYEHLIGQYLTEEEKKARDTFNTNNIDYVDILMETIERSKLQKYLQLQQEEENNVKQENDSDNDDDNSSKDSIKPMTIYRTKQRHTLWGGYTDKITDNHDENKDNILQSMRHISNNEIQLLRQEFITNMYESFLDGNDRDFDYRYMVLINVI